ncbi:response regulator [Geomonas sp. RF6]|uniref:hybrid sensor histidine kinase/response regulator n=1 Tax=Geomonas sp. RF6 TaxID=2897342 RepID=UPI001E4494C9|nr:hybrid sensor histidine kinase/response regulator [Geomonas sp. RF6]UFS71837.1 response regulator [Geomonas sp. RF6]
MLQQTQQAGVAQMQQKAQKTVLVVDDEAIIRDLCMRALRDYHTVEAANGEEALRVYEQGGIDVVLTDVMMPRVDGIELLKALKEREPTIVVIIMTGYADKDLILKALKEDADDFITKPLNLMQLRTAVDKALDKKALKEEIANLKNLDRFKTNFLSLISHKFRTPITSISLFLQNLAAGVYDPSQETNREYAGLIYDEACYLGTLVTDLLTFSHMMDTGEALKLEPCDLPTIIALALAKAKERTDRLHINVECELQPMEEILLDREKFSFALQQVIDNAFKFSKQSGQVRVAMEQTTQNCRIEIEDTGIGIPQGELPKVFEKFYQVDADRTGQIRGFGLGLFYAREFVRMHGGSITLDSAVDSGTKVVITVPRRPGASS